MIMIIMIANGITYLIQKCIIFQPQINQHTLISTAAKTRLSLLDRGNAFHVSKTASADKLGLIFARFRKIYK